MSRQHYVAVGTAIFDVERREFVKSFERNGLALDPATIVRSGTVIASRYDTATTPAGFVAATYGLDVCGRERYAVGVDLGGWQPDREYFDDRFLISRQPNATSRELRFMDTSDGTVSANRRTGRINVLAVGADGTIYASACVPSGDAFDGQIVALDDTLQERWHVSLGANCGNSLPTLRDDGVLLYPDVDVGAQTTEIIAIQTDSPGAARLGLAALYDIRGNRWHVEP